MAGSPAGRDHRRPRCAGQGGAHAFPQGRMRAEKGNGENGVKAWVSPQFDPLNVLNLPWRRLPLQVIYATHIFDGLEFWPSHVAYVARGKIQMLKEAADVPELAQVGGLGVWPKEAMGRYSSLHVTYHEHSGSHYPCLVVFQWHPSHI